jgi:Uma2 family endonuclease
MRTLLPDPPPTEVQKMLEHRRRHGLDRHDEVWRGVLHVVPAPTGEHSSVSAQVKRLLAPPASAAGLHLTDDFNLGDFRVPDGGLHREPPRGTWFPTAALALEVLSPGDETWEKLPFHAAHEVDEVLIVDLDERKVRWLALSGARYEPIERSGLIDLDPARLTQQIDWP